ncbi:MAG: 1-deoxy-D-xylulose-5-phosphate synthase [Spirochaetes bacterium]|nr:1-deoxy-D-xylulose-5-phosphate synthase [Spirochaetota bacterium]
MLLEKINNPKDLKKFNFTDLDILAREIRDFLINHVSQTGGHLASNLGVVELTLALHYVFNAPKDKIIWDVGHQSYIHKIITGRKDKFSTLRQYKGLSGFPKPTESEYDTFIAGHASTSISLACGLACARDLKKEKYHIVSIIGDGALTGGEAFEGLNNLGHLGKDAIIILNTNEMSISPNVGAIATYLNRIITESLYNKIKTKIENVLKGIPEIGNRLFQLKNKAAELIKAFFVPGILFEELGFMYVGPQNGHDIKTMIQTLKRLKKLKGRPILYHIVTVKGKGYQHAEKSPEKFHGVSCFDVQTGNGTKKDNLTYTDVFGRTILQIGKEDKKVITITAAMPEGTGLELFKSCLPERFFDVGIAEQHAVTSAAMMAKEGFKVAVAIYSTFLQRAIDQIIHDVAISRLPVKFFLDRAGIVGSDGETHQGIFDLSYLRMIPHAVILVPKDGKEFRHMIFTAFQYSHGPIFIRYPRYYIPEKTIDFSMPLKTIPIGPIERLKKGKSMGIIATGIMVQEALNLSDMFPPGQCTVLNLRTIKPLDENQLIEYIKPLKHVIIMEENVTKGGINEEIISVLSKNKIYKKISTFGLPDKFIEHGDPDFLREKYGLKAEQIYRVLSTKY